MLVKLFIASLLISSALADEIKPLDDNILFAFDKCKSITVDLNKTVLVEEVTAPFDIHCVNNESDKFQFKCDFFDAGSDKKKSLETLTGGRLVKMGDLSNKGGTKIAFSFEKGSASFQTPLEKSHGMKVCAGIFLLEKDAKKRKK